MEDVFSQLYALVRCVLNKLMSFTGAQVRLEAIQMANGQIIRAVRMTLGSRLPVPMHGHVLQKEWREKDAQNRLWYILCTTPELQDDKKSKKCNFQFPLLLISDQKGTAILSLFKGARASSSFPINCQARARGLASRWERILCNLCYTTFYCFRNICFCANLSPLKCVDDEEISTTIVDVVLLFVFIFLVLT